MTPKHKTRQDNGQNKGCDLGYGQAKPVKPQAYFLHNVTRVIGVYSQRVLYICVLEHCDFSEKTSTKTRDKRQKQGAKQDKTRQQKTRGMTERLGHP